MKTTIVWFRNDLRIHDHPALHTAVTESDAVIPVFIFNQGLLHGKHAGSNRNRFLLESLEDLKNNLLKAGADLILRSGNPADVLPRLAKEVSATEVFVTADYAAYAIKRDKKVKQALKKDSVALRTFPGRLVVSTIEPLHTKAGTTHKIFTPFYKNWLQIERREVAPAPKKISTLSVKDPGKLPLIDELCDIDDLSPQVLQGGETQARKRLDKFLDKPIHSYHETNNALAIEGTSRLSSYLHFGCLSPLECEKLLPQSKGAEAWRRQLCWRDFYHYVLFNFPKNATTEFQERYQGMKWDTNSTFLKAWETGTTGYPIVDASMRQLNKEGWMHNRARLIVGSFLTKDLWLDWRLGERYFMRMLIDGDESNNNGNWQWIASVGVDPAPVFRRLYNPTSQQKNYDPDGVYIRKFVPELQGVPDKYLAEPWRMTEEQQKEAKCIIGKDYPVPIVDHAEARTKAMERYRQAAT